MNSKIFRNVFTIFLISLTSLFSEEITTTLPPQDIPPKIEDTPTPPQEPPQKKYHLAACAIFQDEAPYLREWLEYHKLVGVEHFYLYNNESKDNFNDILAPYIASGEVTLIDWPNKPVPKHRNRRYGPWVTSTQAPAYYNAIEIAKGETDWLAVIDLDEFIVPVASMSLNTYLDKFSNYSQLVIKWQIYGTSNVYSLPAGTLLIEKLIMKSLPSEDLNNSTKTIIKPDDVTDFCWIPHKFNVKPGCQELSCSLDELRINHYINRTIEYFNNVKIKKKERMEGKPMDKLWKKTFLNLGNDIEDPIMLKFVPLLKINVFKPLEINPVER